MKSPASLRTLARFTRAIGTQGLARLEGTRDSLSQESGPPELLCSAVKAPPGELSHFVSQFRARRQHSRFPDIIAALSDQDPRWLERTTRAADRLCQRRVRLLGDDDIDLDARRISSSPGVLPWHCDVLNGYAWQRDLYYKAVSVPVGKADIKVPWELSRSQHLLTLAMAFVATRNESYLNEITTQISDWIATNPVRRGVNWACTMDVAIRAVNWILTYELLEGSQTELQEEFVIALLASLIQHGRHIATNIEEYAHGVTTNHTTADYVGLLYVATFLPEASESSLWRTLAIDGLERCISEQILNDGTDFEGSTSYHRLALELFLGPYLRLGRGEGLSLRYESKLRAMFEVVFQLTRPDGLVPVIGDADDGRLQIYHDYFGWIAQDHRYLLPVGGVLFDRPEWSSLGLDAPGGREELAWQLGTTATSTSSNDISSRRSIALADSGRYIFRNRDDSALVTVSPVGSNGLGHHQHNDCMGFELVFDGIPLIVDAGSYTYTRAPDIRDRFRSTATHSTVMVDGNEQNTLTGVFGMTSHATPRILSWDVGEEIETLVAEHDGYTRLPDPVTHKRTFQWYKSERALVILDELYGRTTHEIISSLQLAPTVTVREADSSDDITSALSLVRNSLPALPTLAIGHEHVRILALGSEARAILVPINVPAPMVAAGAVSPSYGKILPASRLMFTARSSLPVHLGYGLIAASNSGRKQ